MRNHLAARLITAALAIFILLSTFSCRKDEPEPAVPSTPVQTELQVVQGVSTDYLCYPAAASYEDAVKSNNLTLSTTVNVSTGTSNAIARWYLIEDIGPDTEVFMEDIGARDGESDYTSILTLSKELFETLFPAGKFKEQRFYCKFAFKSPDRNINSAIFTSDTMTISTALPAELPVLWVETVNGEEPTCDYVSPPPGNNGAGIRNCTKVPGRLRVSLAGKILYDSGEYVADESGMTIKIRGNTSAYSSQKPYKIKLQKKKDLLFRGDEDTYKDKEWVLIKGYGNLNTFIGLEAAKHLGFSWVPAMRYANVVVNDDYRGLYCLVESYKRNENCRADITERGFLIEKDAYWWNEDLYFDTEGFKSNMKYTFKYPDPEDIGFDQLSYIQAYVDKAETEIRNGGDYAKYLDLESFARWILFHDIFATLDCAGSNMYLAKKDMTSNSKLEMLSPWDFDSIYWNGTFTQCWSNQHNYTAFYFPALLNNTNKVFLEKYKSEWERVRGTIGDHMGKTVGEFVEYYGDAIDQSRTLNAMRWGGSGSSSQGNLEEMNTWLKDRVGFLDRKIAEMK
ncbi:MAG: CotH kinase family protein [Candidatus Cryptobacteroides sp.]